MGKTSRPSQFSSSIGVLCEGHKEMAENARGEVRDLLAWHPVAIDEGVMERLDPSSASMQV